MQVYADLKPTDDGSVKSCRLKHLKKLSLIRAESVCVLQHEQALNYLLSYLIKWMSCHAFDTIYLTCASNLNRFDVNFVSKLAFNQLRVSVKFTSATSFTLKVQNYFFCLFNFVSFDKNLTKMLTKVKNFQPAECHIKIGKISSQITNLK